MPGIGRARGEGRGAAEALRKALQLLEDEDLSLSEASRKVGKSISFLSSWWHLRRDRVEAECDALKLPKAKAVLAREPISPGGRRASRQLLKLQAKAPMLYAAYGNWSDVIRHLKVSQTTLWKWKQDLSREAIEVEVEAAKKTITAKIREALDALGLDGVGMKLVRDRVKDPRRVQRGRDLAQTMAGRRTNLPPKQKRKGGRPKSRLRKILKDLYAQNPKMTRKRMAAEASRILAQKITPDAVRRCLSRLLRDGDLKTTPV